MTKPQTYLIARIVLGTTSGICWFKLVSSVNYAFGSLTSNVFALLSLIQFHPIFYASRTLPNTFAMCLVFLAYAVWLRGKIGKTISYLTACAAIFRFEMAIILLTVFISELYSKNKDRVKNLVRPAVVTFMCCVPLTIGIDSYLWNRPVWPEFEVFYFNVVLNKSHEWGTQPWCWYLQNALPSALLMAYPFAILGMFRSQVPKKIILPSLTFLSTLSYLPHKELRFMFCIIPILNLMAVGRHQVNKNRFF